MTQCQACPATAMYGWQRQATQAEVQRWAADPAMLSVQPHETSALVQVLACEDHALTPDQMAVTHEADCAVPAGPCCGAG